MARPSLDTITRSDSDWLTNLNSNFEKLLDAPFPVHQEGSDLASKYAYCLIVSATQRLKVSNGSAWAELRAKLTYIADLNPATATVTDLVTALNSLMTDMRTKGWMNAS